MHRLCQTCQISQSRARVRTSLSSNLHHRLRRTILVNQTRLRVPLRQRKISTDTSDAHTAACYKLSAVIPISFTLMASSPSAAESNLSLTISYLSETGSKKPRNAHARQTQKLAAKSLPKSQKARAPKATPVAVGAPAPQTAAQSTPTHPHRHTTYPSVRA